jgi:hypothetical protein
MQEWTYNNPWNISWHCCSYCFGKWSTCLEGGLPPFPLPHLMTNGYSYHHKWFLNFDGHCHCWFDSHIYDAMNIGDDNTCSNDGCSRKGKILCWMNTRWWFHSPCHWDILLFSFLLWFTFDHLCIDHYYVSLAIFFSPFDAYFSLLTTCVHTLAISANQSDFLVSYYIWSRFFIPSTHHN